MLLALLPRRTRVRLGGEGLEGARARRAGFGGPAGAARAGSSRAGR